MEKSKFIIFLSMVVIPMILSGILKLTTAITSTSTTSPFVELGRLDKADEDICKGPLSSLLKMKTIKIISKSILNIFNNIKISSSCETSATIASEMNYFIKSLRKTGINLYEESKIIYPAQILKIPSNLEALYNIINDIDVLFKYYYLEYLNGHLSNTALQIFISKAITLNDNVSGKNIFMLQKIFCLHVDNKFRSIFQKNGDNSTCSIHQASQQFMYNLYNSLATIEFKAYIMILSAYKLRAVTSNDDYIYINMNILKKYSEQIQAGHVERMKYYLTIFVNICHQLSYETKACLRKPTTDRSPDDTLFINKLPIETDYRNNKVVTAVRPVIKNQVLYIQIQEGTLFKYTFTLPGDKWIPIDDIDYHSHTTNRSREDVKKCQNVEYHPITSSSYWSLTTVQAPLNYAIVGVSLDVYSSECESNEVIYLRLKIVKVNYITGQLYTSNLRYIDNLGNTFPKLGDDDLADENKYFHMKRKNDPYKKIFYIPTTDGEGRLATGRLATGSINSYKTKWQSYDVIHMISEAIYFLYDLTPKEYDNY